MIRHSLAVQLSELPPNEYETLLQGMTDQEAAQLLYDWRFWARPNQLPPEGNWRVWLLLAGRGFGKTRTGAEYIIDQVRQGVKRIALVSPTPADARDVMVQGESGILTISPPWFMPKYEPSKRRLTWENGAMATIYSGAHPEQLRGPQHELAWADELAAWKYPQETWDMLMFGLRLGTSPRAVVTTTPKPIPVVKALLKSTTTAITHGSTFDNAHHLAPAFLEQIISKYQGTRLGRQELYAEILDDVPGALWKRGQIEESRVSKYPDLTRVVIGIDPAVTTEEESNETGIIVSGKGIDGRAYILEDVSLQATPDGWARKAVQAYHQYKADRIVAEANNGGDMIEYTLRTIEPTLSYKKVHASRGKQTRAEPIAALYEQGKVHHVGSFPELEDQMCNWAPGEDSPDRMDALVWALTELMLKPDRPKVKVSVG